MGGAERLRSVALLAAVTSLDGADKATLAVNAGSLEHAFGVSHAGIGLLASATALTGAVFTLPVGALTDRVNRVRLLGTSILLWAVATALSGAVSSFAWLLAARVLLSAVTVTAGPTVASLVGDYFPAAERARLYGYVLAGELLGTGAGYLVSSGVAALGSWRLSLAWPALPALLLAHVVRRAREPARGGQPPYIGGRAAPGNGHGPAGARRPDAADGAAGPASARPHPGTGTGSARPRPGAPPVADPAALSFWQAVLMVLRIRTVIVVITASALGYFFFAGVRTFAVLFATQHYGLGRASAGLFILVVGVAGVGGLFLGGRTADRLLDRGYVNARIIVPVLASLAAPLALAPAIVSTSALAAAPLLALGTALLTAPNPPLDAARLDVVPPGVWGRAEAVRTTLRTLGEFSAPLVFGYLAADVFTHDGLKWAFLVCLAPLVGAGLLGLAALRTYPRDLAAASAWSGRARGS
ncbi:MFS transporter [Streptomyces sp. NPDC095613]|uniref:MFS transporter n=1 Tax=Streptomyces sp. NPDC095613 TaxID=3155540 RepID=UPI0033234E3B